MVTDQINMATDSVLLQNNRGRFVGGNSLGHLHKGQFFHLDKSLTLLGIQVITEYAISPLQHQKFTITLKVTRFSENS